ncbi:MAG: TonB-dependent receptor [Flavobacteriaceae bacterium]
MKKSILITSSNLNAFKQSLRLKFTLFFLFFTLLSIQANTYSQVTKLSLNMQNATLESILDEIETNTKFKFIFNTKHINLNSTTSVKANDVSITKILDDLFANTNIEFEIVNRKILLHEKKTPALYPQAIIQEHQVTGLVTDANGQPMSGANITVKNNPTKGTLTDFDGKYAITVSNKNATLVFSYLGFVTKEIAINSQTTINATLEEDASTLDEVVVVGYGTQRKSDLTGAIGIAQGEILENRAITSIGEGLQGALPGLNITPSSGSPGESMNINIRGTTSINGGSPLILVDGTQMDLNLVNPEEIESISVLKDAASASIYGARAAFGVILVTTKKGKRNTKPQINYNMNAYLAKPTVIPKKANSYKYALYINDMRANTGLSTTFNDDHLALIKDRVDGVISTDYTLKPDGSSFYEHANTDWADLVFADNAFGQNHNLSITGGSEKSNYRVAYGYTKKDGIVKIGNDFYKRHNLDLNLGTDLTDWLTTRFQINFSKIGINTHRLPPGHGSSIFHTVWRARPILTPYIEIDGIEYPTFIRLNPVGTLKDGGRIVNNYYNLNTKGSIEMTFGDFKIFSNFTYNPYVRERRDHNVEFQSATPWANLNIRTDGGPSSIERNTYINNYYAFDAYTTYKKSINDAHNFDITVGFNQEWKEFLQTDAYNTNLISESLLSLSNTTGTPLISDSVTDWALRSGFARINYNYKGKYLIGLNGRYDGSSRFAKDDRFGFFPSISLGWKISDEKFMSNVHFVNLFKLRASYGSLGNQSSSRLYPFVGYNTISQVNYAFDGVRPLGVTPQNPLGNKRTWETVTTKNLGVDLSLFDNRLDATFDIFTRTTKDMLVDGDALPGVYGTNAPQKNAADLEVNGFEFSIDWNDSIGENFSYNIGFNVGDAQGKITKFDNPTNSLSRAFYEGQKIGEIWGYQTVGLFQSQDEIDAAADHSELGGGNLIAPGDVHYADLNNDDKINTGEGTVDNSGDIKVIGNQTPRYTYGIRGGAKWKGFDMNFFFQGVGKRDYWLSGPILFGGDGGYGNAIVTDELFDNVWSDGSGGIPENRNGYYFRASEGVVMNRNKRVQTRYLQDASYLRLKNLTIGYTFPSEMLRKNGVSNLRLYVSGENLITFSSINKSFDPEILDPSQSNFGSANTSTGSDQSGKLYPLSTNFSIGLSVTF